jgi:hypothetical protein
MDITFHYPPDLMSLLIEVIPALCRAKKDVLLFFQRAGVGTQFTGDLSRQLKESPDEVNKHQMVRTVLTRLNEKGEATLRERRELLRRVVKFEDFSWCWDDDRHKAKALVADIRKLVNVKDAFTRMQQEREAERKKHSEQVEAEAKLKRQREQEVEAIKSTQWQPRTSPQSCPLHRDDCPLHRPSKAPPVSAAPKTSAETGPDGVEDLEQIFRLLAVGGGPAGSAGKRFLDLTRKATKGCQGIDVRQVIVTDPYLHTSFDESGGDGDGFEWFGQFLRDGLGLTPEQSFELFLHPGMGDAFDPLRRRIAAVFLKASIKPFAVQGGRIHDRFYLVRGKDGVLRGVFGPSMNGLSGRGVFLMGDLEREALGQLDKIIQCR